MGAALVGLVSVILISALKRLLLYENAYGFTRLRTYTHVAIYWMGLLFVVFLVLLITGHLRRFALAGALCAVGFVATLNLLNVDAFITTRNTTRLAETVDDLAGYLGNEFGRITMITMGNVRSVRSGQVAEGPGQISLQI